VIQKIVLAFVLAVAVVAALIMMQPNEYKVVRTTTIAAPPEKVFANVNDFHRWDAWSPWAKIDPAMKVTFAGPPAGNGAIYNWSGDEKAGEGSMLISDSMSNDHVTIQLSFIRPYVSNAVITLGFQPEGSGTKTTWTMTGKNNFALKAISLFYSMDRMVGPDFERGLSQLKAVAEAPAR
jgi:hypothetical protein